MANRDGWRSRSRVDRLCATDLRALEPLAERACSLRLLECVRSDSRDTRASLLRRVVTECDYVCDSQSVLPTSVRVSVCVAVVAKVAVCLGGGGGGRGFSLYLSI